MKDKENVKNIIIGGAGFIIFLLVLILMANIQKEREKNEDWRVEGQVIKREAVTRDDEKNGTEKVYLIDCEDENGVVHTFELTDAALDGNISAKEAFREIETGKAYRFKVGWREKEIMDKPRLQRQRRRRIRRKQQTGRKPQGRRKGHLFRRQELLQIRKMIRKRPLPSGRERLPKQRPPWKLPQEEKRNRRKNLPNWKLEESR